MFCKGDICKLFALKFGRAEIFIIRKKFLVLGK